jgi:hypothetical protein
MARLIVCGVVALLVIPAVAAADPIPVTGIVEPDADYGASVRLDRGGSYAGTALAGNMSGGSGYDDGSPRGLLYAPTGPLGSQFASTAGDLAAGAYDDGLDAEYGPVMGALIGPAGAPEVGQAFRDAFGTLSAAEIEADELAPIVGAMEATDALSVGGGQAATAFIAPTADGLVAISAPEPASLLLLGSGLLAIAHRQRRKHRAGVE